jgi:ATP synthase protein I
MATPQDKQPASPAAGPPAKNGSALQSLVQVEKLVQLGLLIPCATCVGWVAGAGLDRFFHQHWIFLVGLLMGATAGFIQMFRVVLANTKE